MYIYMRIVQKVLTQKEKLQWYIFVAQTLQYFLWNKKKNSNWSLEAVGMHSKIRNVQQIKNLAKVFTFRISLIYIYIYKKYI